MSQRNIKVIVVTGVAGAGKTAIGALLADQLGWAFADADDFHSAENKQKMSSGLPLTEEDRQPWLTAMHAAIANWCTASVPHVLACSALKAAHREHLRVADSVQFVYLRADKELIRSRLEKRVHHFMKSNMVESQFATLEAPSAQEALLVDARMTLNQIVALIQEKLSV